MDTHLLMLFPDPHAYLYLKGMSVVTDWQPHTHERTHTVLQTELLFSFSPSKVMCTTIQKENWKETMREQDRGTWSGTFSVSYTHAKVEYRWYSQSFSVAGDIPWHGFETQSMAVYCGAAAGTQGWAGAGITHEEGKEHHHPHPEWLPGQPAHAFPKTATFNEHIHRSCSLLFFNNPLLLSAKTRSPATPCKSSRIFY